ncbi:kinase associated protein phosphatase1 [Zea mays]|uniref:protein-serine/threonine phosphatase n=1 Tax=Zea mays TaxID=4577 RepID=A0A1D6HW07_MAIZE|nr:kinase associated protein phosphatase1 [Zea mays]
MDLGSGAARALEQRQQAVEHWSRCEGRREQWSTGAAAASGAASGWTGCSGSKWSSKWMDWMQRRRRTRLLGSLEFLMDTVGMELLKLILPEHLGYILSHPETKERVQSYSDASDVLRYAFTLTEDTIDHQYEGCTGTALLIWFDQNKDCFAQCANLGDSACVMSVNGKTIDMTEDHRVTSATERARIARTGQPLRDGEARLSGLNLARMFGDKFLKEQDPRFSSEPYVSQAVRITKACTAFAVIASDGLWDVISTKRAVQLVVEGKERRSSGDATSAAARVASRVLDEARSLRTKDNTSVIFVDFDVLRRDPCISPVD